MSTFSGKQRRNQIKVARSSARKNTGPLRVGEDADEVVVVSEEANAFRGASWYDPNQLQTVYKEREPEYEITKRKVAARNPLRRQNQDFAVTEGFYRQVIDIPVRPPWNSKMKKSKVIKNEEKYYGSWLEGIFTKYEAKRLNHFEQNLGVWRQLWRVCERCDLLVLVVDARHPLFHFPPSLYSYVNNICKKPFVVALNKIDMITKEVLAKWLRYFKTNYPQITVVPITSYPHDGTITLNLPDGNIHQKQQLATKRKHVPVGLAALRATWKHLEEALSKHLQAEKESDEKIAAEIAAKRAKEAAAQPSGYFSAGTFSNWKDETTATSSDSKPSRNDKDSASADTKQSAQPAPSSSTNGPSAAGYDDDADSEDEFAPEDAPDEPEDSDSPADTVPDVNIGESHKLPTQLSSLATATFVPHTAEEKERDFIYRLRMKKQKGRTQMVRIGMIGHPNAGKSSLINGLCGKNKVGVSATPGYTKHLQTIRLNDLVELYDCPGLVFPAVDMPKELQVLCGLFPVSQVREPYSAVRFLAERVRIEDVYNLKPMEAQPIQEAEVSDSKALELELDQQLTLGDSSDEPKGRPQSKKQNKPNKPASKSSAPTRSTASGAVAKLPSQLYPNHPWSAWELCECYAKMKNFRMPGGGLDTHRAALEILYDAVNGVIVLSFEPPASAAVSQSVSAFAKTLLPNKPPPVAGQSPAPAPTTDSATANGSTGASADPSPSSQ